MLRQFFLSRSRMLSKYAEVVIAKPFTSTPLLMCDVVKVCVGLVKHCFCCAISPTVVRLFRSGVTQCARSQQKLVARIRVSLVVRALLSEWRCAGCLVERRKQRVTILCVVFFFRFALFCFVAACALLYESGVATSLC